MSQLRPRPAKSVVSATILATLALTFSLFGLLIIAVSAADPSWWSSRGAVVPPRLVYTNGSYSTNYIPNNYALATQGQVKQFTARAVAEMNANLTNGAGMTLNGLVTGWQQDYATNGYSGSNPKPSDSTVMNVGQLKYIGNKIWSQLVANGYTNAIPSYLAQNTNTDQTAANLGQLKQVFNFRLNPNSAASPTFSPNGGTYTSAQTVTLNTGTPGATIYYTVDGSTPTSSSPSLAPGGTININSPETIQAVAVAPGVGSSSVVSAIYVFQTASLTLSPAPGLYNSPQTVTLATGTPGATVYYTINGGTPTTSSPSMASGGSLSISNSSTIQAFASLIGYKPSAVVYGTYIVQLPQAPAPTLSPGSGFYPTAPTTVTLTSAIPGAKIYYALQGGQPPNVSNLSPFVSSGGTVSVPQSGTLSTYLSAFVTAPGYSQSNFAMANYNFPQPAAPVSFSPGTGTYTSIQNVQASSYSGNATIYYTTDGSTPTISSRSTSNTIVVNSSETVRAFAQTSTSAPSIITAATYTLQLPPAAPTFSIGGGTYTSTQSVTISSATPNAVIYYTTDGSMPSSHFPNPTSYYLPSGGTVFVNASETINAVASGVYGQSGIDSATYTLLIPTNLVATPTSSSSVYLTWTNNTSSYGTVIQQSTDGGASWQTAATVAAGVSSYSVTGLSSDVPVQFQLLTNSGGGGTGSGSGGGTPSSPPVTPLSAPSIVGENESATLAKYGFAGFQNAANRYLSEFVSFNTIDNDNDGEGGSGTLTTTYDPLSGNQTSSSTGTGEFFSGIGGNVLSDTSETQTGNTEDDDPNDLSNGSLTLSSLNTTPMLLANALIKIPAFTNTFTPGISSASYQLASDETSVSLTDLQYKFKVNSAPSTTVNWLVVFTPSDGTALTSTQMSWTGSNVLETPVYTITPTALEAGKNGTYQLLPIAITPQTIPTTGVGRAKLVFGSGVQVPTIDPSSSQLEIKIGSTYVSDIHQDDKDPHTFYFTVPAGAAGPADVTITGITIPGMPWLSTTPPQTMTLPSFVQYTDDVVKATKSFSDGNVVAIDEDKSTLDYLIQQGTITSSQAFDTFSTMRDTDAQTAEPDMEEFFSSHTPDSGALDSFTQNVNNELSVVYATYPPPMGGGGATSGGVAIIASTPDAYEAGPNSGLFTISRPSASTTSLTVNYTIGGTATNGTDYTTIAGSVTIAANQTTAQIVVAPIQHALGANKTVVLTLSTSTSYSIDSNYNAATVTIYDYGNGITSNTSLKKNTHLVARNAAPRPVVDQLFTSHFFVQNGAHMSVNPSALFALMLGQTTPPPLPPELGTSTFFSDVQSRLAATGSKMYCGTTYLRNTSGLPLESGRSSVPINYFVFSADNYHLTVYPASAVGTIIDNAVSANPSASLIINGAQCNYHCPNLLKRIISHLPGGASAATSNPEPFQTIGVVVHGGSVLSPTSSTSSKGSWATALARYWFGQSTAANSGQALSYQFGQGNPTASATPEALGGLTGFIYPSGHALSGAEAKDLRVYSPDRLGGGLPGFNVIGVDRNTGMVIVVTKDHEMQGSLFDVQALLTASGVDLAEVTDGGGSVGCWSKATGYVSKGERQVGTPDNHNTVTTYLIFSPNP